VPFQTDPNELLTPRQAAKLLGVSAATVRKWAARGKLVAWKPDTDMFVTRTSVLALLEREGRYERD